MDDDPAGRPELRASDLDRDRTMGVLARHGAEGRLSMDELAERSAQAGTARTLGELDRLVADLPPLPAAPVRTGRERPGRGDALPGRRGFPRTLAMFVLLNLFLVAIWAAGGRGAFWPIWSIIGTGFAVGALAVRVFFGPAGRDR